LNTVHPRFDFSPEILISSAGSIQKRNAFGWATFESVPRQLFDQVFAQSTYLNTVANLGAETGEFSIDGRPKSTYCRSVIQGEPEIVRKCSYDQAGTERPGAGY
jgi:hypothetical protein